MDDSGALRPGDWWSREFSRVLPPGQFPIVDIPISHPIMHSVYDVKEFLQVGQYRLLEAKRWEDVRTRP